MVLVAYNTNQKVLIELLKKMSPFEHMHPNLIMLNTTDKDKIAESIGLVGNHVNGKPKKYDINKYLGDLVKHKILRKLSSGYYLVISDLFTKVDWNKTSMMREIELKVTYNIKGVSFVTLVEEYEQHVAKKQIEAAESNVSPVVVEDTNLF